MKWMKCEEPRMHCSIVPHVCVFVVALATAFAHQCVARTLVSAGKPTWVYNLTAKVPPWYLNDHTIVLGPDGVWHVFGITHTEPFVGDEVNFGHAISHNEPTTPDTFHTQPYAMGNKPPETLLWAPHIVRVREGGQWMYRMFYCGGSPVSRDSFAINMAWSTNLYSWTRNGTLFTGGVDGRDPMVMNLGPAHNNTWIIYYCGTDPDDATVQNVSHVTYYRTSNDMSTWSDPAIAFDGGVDGHNYGGPTESPFVVRRGGSFYLFSGSWAPSYTDTRVFVSSSPFNFGSVPKGTAAQVGSIESHAPEVLRDQKGNWFITSAGWERGGLHMMPLTWLDHLDNETTSLPPADSQGTAPCAFKTNLLGLPSTMTPPRGASWACSMSGLQLGCPLATYRMLSTSVVGPQVKEFRVVATGVTLVTRNGNPGGTNGTYGSAAELLLYANSLSGLSVGVYVDAMGGTGVALARTSPNGSRVVLAQNHSCGFSQDSAFRLEVDVHTTNDTCTRRDTEHASPVCHRMDIFLDVCAPAESQDGVCSRTLVLSVLDATFSSGAIGVGVTTGSAWFASVELQEQ